MKKAGTSAVHARFSKSFLEILYLLRQGNVVFLRFSISYDISKSSSWDESSLTTEGAHNLGLRRLPIRLRDFPSRYDLEFFATTLSRLSLIVF